MTLVSYVTVATVARDRWFDLDAVRGPGSDNTHARLAKGVNSRPTNGKKAENPNNNFGSMNEVETAGAPPLDWMVADREELLALLVKSMCPRHVCTVCGEPRRRMVGEATYDRTDTDRVPARLAMIDGDRVAEGVNQHTQTNGANTSVTRNAPTLGWSDCGHDNYRPGLVLDPFAGSGTVGQVATGCGRDALLIDLDARNLDLARERIGMFLEESA